MNIRNIKGFEDKYTINENGVIYSYNLKTGREPKKMSTSKTSIGYEIVGLYYKGKKHTFLVQSLMMKNFYGPTQPGYYVTHKDGNKMNNTLTNLQFTKAEDVKRGRVPKRIKVYNTNTGETKIYKTALIASKELNMHNVTVRFYAKNSLIKNGLRYEYLD